mmetsp:Transcript_73824/g.149874  ORF Transcript_73824/g.149874 Transcript_73824/m.149874 type:complete len:257 (-) Transcript_73824:687-1457(-)
MESPQQLRSQLAVSARDVERKHGVRPRGNLIHVCATHGTGPSSPSHEGSDLFLAIDLDTSHVGHDGAPSFVVLDDVNRCSTGAGGVVSDTQEVAERLVVDLEKGSMQLPSPALAARGLAGLKDLAQGARDEAPTLWRLCALHGEGLSGPRLAVCEDTNLVAVEGRLHKARDLVEDISLRGRGFEDLVKAEIVALPEAVDRHLVHLLQPQGGLGARALFLCRRHGSHAAEDPDVALEFLDGVVELPTCPLGLLEIRL